MKLYTISGIHFADAYNAGSYGECPYNQAGTCSTTTGGNSGLANTGIIVGTVVGVACLLLLVAILVRFWRRPAQVPAEEQISKDEAEEDPGQQDITPRE